MLLQVFGRLFPYKTKEQRKHIYLKVLEILVTEEENYICPVLAKALDISPQSLFLIIHRFPELYKLKPIGKRISVPWWQTDRFKRISVMIGILEKMEKGYIERMGYERYLRSPDKLVSSLGG